MIKKIIRNVLPIIWMAFIFYLSSRPADFFPVRNEAQSYIAHFILYFILALLFAFALVSWENKISFKKILISSFLFSIIYAGLDEFHQSFVVTRSASLNDWFVDAISSIIALILYYKLLKPKLLLHICCIGCGAYIAQILKNSFRVTLYFYNPNIYPREEYKKRLEEIKKISNLLNLPIIIEKYDHDKWLNSVKGYESLPEKSERCLICYRIRMEKTARYAKENSFDFFTTTLSISPYKDSAAIINIGEKLENQYKVKFFRKDFKKKDGFKKSAELSKKLGLYRQNYCGCEFSIKSRNK